MVQPSTGGDGSAGDGRASPGATWTVRVQYRSGVIRDAAEEMPDQQQWQQRRWLVRQDAMGGRYATETTGEVRWVRGVIRTLRSSTCSRKNNSLQAPQSQKCSMRRALRSPATDWWLTSKT